MAAEAVGNAKADPAFGNRPRRSSYLIRQAINSLLYGFLVLLLLFLAIIWTIVITFSIVPVILWKRGYRKVPEYYSAPFELQSDLFRSYRSALRKGRSEWDYEKGRPPPIAMYPRGFKSQEGKALVQPDSMLILKLPPEIRHQIYKEIILEDSTHVRVSVHRRRRPDEKWPKCIIHGRLSTDPVGSIPAINCNCFDLREHGHRPLQCRVPSTGHPERGILALSLTCRQMYTETIDLLYS